MREDQGENAMIDEPRGGARALGLDGPAEELQREEQKMQQSPALSTRERDLIGYAGSSPDPQWPGRARVAVSIVVNFEEGAEFLELLLNWCVLLFQLECVNL